VMTYIGMPPEYLSSYIYNDYDSYYPMYYFGDNGYLYLNENTNYAYISGEPWGIWNSSIYGYYNNPDGLKTWGYGGGTFDKYWGYGGSFETVKGTDNLNGLLKLDYDYAELDMYDGYLYRYSGTFFNSYTNYTGDYNLIGVGMGTYVDGWLTFEGQWAGYGGGYGGGGGLSYYKSPTEIGWAGESRGLTGGVTILGSGPAYFLALGEYYDDGTGGPYIWNSHIYGEGYGGGFDGFAGGVWRNGSIKGNAITLYGYGGGYGILTSDVAGSYFASQAKYVLDWSEDSRVTYTAVKPGFDGNNINITYIVSGTETPLSISVTDSSITVYVATDVDGYPVSTASAIAAAINADINASALVTAVYGGNGSGVVQYTYGSVYLEGGSSMWMAEGVFTPVAITTNPNDLYPETYPFNVDQYYGKFTGGGGIDVSDSMGYSKNLYYINGSYTPETWGILGNIQFGTYSGTTSDDWLMLEKSIEEGSSTWIQMLGNKWSEGEVAADAAGAWVTLGLGTGVIGGELAGTFDPNAYTWQAIASGSYIDTARFLAMADPDNVEGNKALEALNIPYIEIGRTDLASTSTTGALTSVSMDDVTFFAYSDGAMPRIWATGSLDGGITGGVSGTTSAYGTDVNNSTATLSGEGFNNSVTFKVNNYGAVGENWDASVDGAGVVGGHSIDITGGAAGTVDTDTGSGTEFSGTGAGIATPQVVLP
jgi:hypothetical protein